MNQKQKLDQAISSVEQIMGSMKNSRIRISQENDAELSKIAAMILVPDVPRNSVNYLEYVKTAMRAAFLLGAQSRKVTP